MRRLPVLQPAPAWRSLEDRARQASPREIAPLDEVDEGVSRRSFLQVMGASVALASLSGCRRPTEHIYPYGGAPEEIVPGRPQRYASAMPFSGTAIGVVVESHEGRPTKIEGNPLHPDSLGGASTFAQAAVLELYDPDRSRTPRQQGTARTWAEAVAMLRDQATKLGDGKGLAILTEAHRSPALLAQLAALRLRFPAARVVRYEPLSRQAAVEGARLALGRRLEPLISLQHAKVVLALDADLLFGEGSAIKHARAFAEGRRVPSPEMNRLYAIESSFTVTGAAADHRLRVQSRRVYALALAIARALGRPLGTELPDPGALSPEEKRLVEAVARDLVRVGQDALVVAGELQPPEVHALAQLINLALGAGGRTMSWVAPFSDDPEGATALVELAAAMRRGEIACALVLGGNPVYAAPRSADFAAALAKVPLSVHVSGWVDETSHATTWHLPRAHWLESWGDVRAEDGTWSVVQPLIAPLHGGRSELEVVEALLGGTRSAYTIVSDTWKAALGTRFTAPVFRRVLHDGLLADSASPLERVQAAPAALPPPRAGRELELTFHADVHAHDGRYANNAWLQELPAPMTKLTWGNAALVSPATAAKLALSDGDVVELSVDGVSLRAPVLRAPGQADGSIAISIGQGRTQAGLVGSGVGYNATPLRPVASGILDGASLRKTGASQRLALTQEHDRMEGRPLVREATVAHFEEEPQFAKEPDREHPPLDNLYADHKYDGHRWGMVIDLQTCIGCNACMVACQAENNIPVVGQDGVLRSREMHWIRIDRYFTGSEDDPQAVMQPISCHHCEQAPCEAVCPVGATTHSPEGLNDMAYNRCVGTRYCANNCPYKVRRYNFYNYNRDVPELRRMQLNPDVTVRARGVMEKCSYCVQRINGAKIAAHAAGHDRIVDGAVLSACQQTCPSQAIAFGDLNDPKSLVARRAEDPRRYVLLEELNIRPRTSFLARVRNPNPELG